MASRKRCGSVAGFVLVIEAASCPAYAADLRLFFSLDDAMGDGHPIMPGPSAENGVIEVPACSGVPMHTPSELHTHAIPDGGAGGSRLYFWGTGELGDPDPNIWNGIGIRFAIEGTAQVVGGGSLNVISPPSSLRWDTASDFDPRGTPSRVNLIATTRVGLQLPAFVDGWGNNDNAVFLGYLEIGPGMGSMYFEVDEAGISRRNGNQESDRVFFGWGDDPVSGRGAGRRSALPDAVFTPEPAGVFVLTCGLLAFARR
ncbi:MAG: hypothetical protein JNG88_02330 [Phycisphaerales bacterium]|nr:hypothetical protein [Phycisphaerales bacterium]